AILLDETQEEIRTAQDIVPEAEAYDPRPLFERLQANKLKEEEANQIKRLDDDEIAFLKQIDSQKKELNLQQNAIETSELENFRKLRAATMNATSNIEDSKSKFFQHTSEKMSKGEVKKGKGISNFGIVKKRKQVSDFQDSNNGNDSNIPETEVISDVITKKQKATEVNQGKANMYMKILLEEKDVNNEKIEDIKVNQNGSGLGLLGGYNSESD
ncbi:hypothetical protein HK096_006341, partial [Nowakowskiella sp. JEL0078]